MRRYKAHLRPMLARDMTDVLQLEKDEFGDDAWDLWTFRRRQDTPTPRAPKQHTLVLASDDRREQVLGFVAYEMHRTYIALSRVIVRDGWRDAGLGTQMVDHVRHRLSPDRRRELIAHVPERDPQGNYRIAACEFFAGLGFRSRLAKRIDCGQDAVRFWFTVTEQVEAVA